MANTENMILSIVAIIALFGLLSVYSPGITGKIFSLPTQEVNLEATGGECIVRTGVASELAMVGKDPRYNQKDQYEVMEMSAKECKDLCGTLYTRMIYSKCWYKE